MDEDDQNNVGFMKFVEFDGSVKIIANLSQHNGMNFIKINQVSNLLN